MQRSRSRKNTRLFRTLLSCVLSIVCCMGVFLCNSLSSSAEVSILRKYEIPILYSYVTFNGGLYDFYPVGDEITINAARSTNYHCRFNTNYQLNLESPYGVSSVDQISYTLEFNWNSRHNLDIFDHVIMYVKIGDYSFRQDNDRFTLFSYSTDFVRDESGLIIDHNTMRFRLDFTLDTSGVPMTGFDHIWFSINCVDRYYGSESADYPAVGYLTLVEQNVSVTYNQKEFDDYQKEQIENVNSNLGDVNSNLGDVNSNLGDVNSNLDDLNSNIDSNFDKLEDSLTTPSSDVSANVDDFEDSVSSGIQDIMDQEQSWQDSVDAIYESYGIDPDSMEHRFSNVVADLRLEVTSGWLSDFWGFLKEYKFLYLFLNTGLVFCMIVFLLRR